MEGSDAPLLTSLVFSLEPIFLNISDKILCSDLLSLLGDLRLSADSLDNCAAAKRLLSPTPRSSSVRGFCGRG